MNASTSPRPHLLLVEDDPGDPILVREALRELKLEAQLTVAQDGNEALELLRGQGPRPLTSRPDLILLDLNLPHKSGYETLPELKADERLRRIPVIVFSTSSAPESIRSSYNHHANCYIVKPVTMDGYMTVIKAIHSFWFKTVRRPSR